jgi:tRNA A-37 threonylcarbamoyl transferase component Bud32
VSDKLSKQILQFAEHVAGSSPITAVCLYGGYPFEASEVGSMIQVLLVIRGFPPRLMNYVKISDNRTLVFLAVDEWIFERDIDRGFLGEALAWSLVVPHRPLKNADYLGHQEVKLKKRLIVELLENLVLNFPELSYELCIDPQYFLYGTVLSRERLFPPATYSIVGFLENANKKENVEPTLEGYGKAIAELEKEHVVAKWDGYVRITDSFLCGVRSPRKRLINLSKNVPRTLFTSLLGIFPQILKAISKNRQLLLSLQRITAKHEGGLGRIGAPEDYLFVPTASGLVPLGTKLGIDEVARKVLSIPKKEKVEITPIGGILNDVFLASAIVGCEERRVVIKRFRDWWSFKWFPLVVWTVGTKTFSVLGRSRLERECAISQLLYSKGIKVPRILYVSHEKRLVVKEFVKGEGADAVIKRMANTKNALKVRKDLKVVERIGRRLAKVHALGIALGDTKPENILIDEHGEIFLMDLEQASRRGDAVWDVAEFLFYAGHDLSALVDVKVAEAVAGAFVSGYLEVGGSPEVVRKSATPKYTKVFSIFTFPPVMLAISNVCRRTRSESEA